MAAAARKKNPYDTIDKKTPSTVVTQLEMAAAAYNAGKFQDCVQLSQQVLRAEPNQPQAANLLSTSLHRLGQLKDAYLVGKQLVQLHPMFAQAQNNLAILCKNLGKPEEALKFFHAALDAGYTHANVYIELGDLYMYFRKEYARASFAYSQALLANPELEHVWEHFRDASQRAGELQLDARLAKILAQSLTKSTSFDRPKGYLACAYILYHCGLNTALDECAEADKFSQAFFEHSVTQTLLREPMLLNYMTYHMVCARDVELFLTYVRGFLLLETAQNPHAWEALAKPCGRFARALEIQSFRNEYVLYITPEEERALAQIKAQIEALTAYEWNGKRGQWLVSLYACYAPLSELALPASAEELYKAGSDSAKNMLKRHLLEPAQEHALAQEIAVLEPVAADVSRKVQAMYEENPYPRWETLPAVASLGVHRELQHVINPSFHSDVAAIPDAPTVLVAGCGTGSHALQTHARLEPSELLAVDLSLASLAYASRKTQEAKVNAIDYMQADILELGGLGRQFDIVESIGVIHHMKDPEEGLSQLLACLKPQGFLRLGLYSELARASIVACRAFIAQEGFAANAQGIRAFRQHAFAHGTAENGMLRPQTLKDFFSLSGCRDLMFHVQEHRYTIAAIREMLERHGLEFLGFDAMRDYQKNHFLAQQPSEGALWSLECWEAYEQANPDTFIAMYNFWVRRKEA